ncbi:hypothetical protein GO496_14045 [Acidovorax citrulli]|nr:hypothetical protein [Paracidovorax citrulli]
MARAAAIPIEQLHLMNENQREILVQRIAHEYWEHALWQERDFPGFFHSLKMQASAWALTEDKPLMHLAGRTAYRQPRISTHCTVPHTATKAA